MRYMYVLNPHVDVVYEARIEDGAVERFIALGWDQVDKPEEGSFIPNSLENLTIVRLWYMAMNVSHDYPNQAEVLAGALEAGWIYP